MVAPYTTLSPATLPGRRYSFVAKDEVVVVSLTVWSKTGTYRYLRTQAAGSGTTVTMKQARNERRSFQILARADGQVANFDIATAALSDGNGNTIAASNLVVYRAHQIEVIQATYRNASDDTTGTLGWYPDALVPTVNPVDGTTIDPGYTYQALPFTLPTNQTHTFLIDVFVPGGTVAGDYTGTLTVSATGQADVEVTVSLHVWDWSLPDTPALKTYVGHPASQAFANYGWSLTDEQWDDLWTVCNTVLSKHGLAATEKTRGDSYFRPEENGTWVYPADEVVTMQAHIDAYYPSTYNIGKPAYDIVPYDADELVAYVDAWEAGIVVINRPDTVYLSFLQDEAYSDPEYTFQWGPEIYASDVECLVGTPEQTTFTGAPDFVGSVNIWSLSMTTYHTAGRAAATDLIAAGNTFWLYTALAGTNIAGNRPWWALDRPLLNYRVLPWVIWHEGFAGMQYWEVSYAKSLYWAGGDPWSVACTFMVNTGKGTVSVTEGNTAVTGSAAARFTEQLDQFITIIDSTGAKRYGHQIGSITDDQNLVLDVAYQGITDTGLEYKTYPYNGEGLVAYPCQTAEIGYNGIVPSMRLKAIRDGVQDFGYITRAFALGLSQEADTEVDALITVIGDGDWEWDSNPDAYEAARERLGAAIEAVPLANHYYHHLLAGSA